jgi:large subunit ribosomal protein L13
MIIDATDLILGRLCSFAAKKALLGEKVDIVNCEKSVVSGARSMVLDHYKMERRKSSVSHGPRFPRNADRVVRRTIRGMLPYKFEKGIKAFDRVMCYVGVPKEFEGKKLEAVKDADVKQTQMVRFIRLGDICKEIGVNE